MSRQRPRAPRHTGAPGTGASCSDPSRQFPSHWPKPLARESVARTGLQVSLEGLCLRAIRKGDVRDQHPRAMLGRVAGRACVVLGDAPAEVGRDADIAPRWVTPALKQIDVVQRSPLPRQYAWAALLRQGFAGHPASPRLAESNPAKPEGRSRMVRSRRLELPRVTPQRPQRCASTNSATTASPSEARGLANAPRFGKATSPLRRLGAAAASTRAVRRDRSRTGERALRGPSSRRSPTAVD